MTPPDILLRKLRQHSRLDPSDVAAIRKLSFVYRELESGEDFCRQGDKATACAVVSRGMLARYHTRSDGKRQYISLHISGDWADAQGLSLDHMDHSVCAMGEALGMSIATVNRNLQKLRKSGAAQWSGGILTVKNWEKLTAIGGFDASYIYQKVQGKR